MRRIIFLVPALLCLIVKGQNDQTYINAIWHSTTQVNALQNINSIHSANLNGVTLGASNYEVDDALLYRLQCLNPIGDVVWQTDPNNPEQGQCTHNILLENGQSLVAGFSPSPDDPNVLKSQLTRLSANGQPNWSVIDSAGESTSSMSTSLHLAADSTLWYASVIWDIDGVFSRLQHLTLDGEILWTESVEGIVTEIQTIDSNARVLTWFPDASNWYGKVIKCSYNGEFIGETVLDQSIATPDSFCAFERDLSGNLIIVCKKTVLGNTSTIVWSLSDSLELNWTNTYHVPGTDLTPRDVVLSDSGDIYVGGYAQTTGAPQSILLTHILNDGTLVSHCIPENTEGGDLQLENLMLHSDLLMAHLISNEAKDLLVGFKDDKIAWSRPIGESAVTTGQDLLPGLGKFYQNWTDSFGVRHMECLSIHQLTNTISADQEFIDNQLVVQFDPSVIQMAFVENSGLRFGRPNQVVGQALVEQLSASCGVELGQKCTVVKIFPGLKPSDRIQ